MHRCLTIVAVSAFLVAGVLELRAEESDTSFVIRPTLQAGEAGSKGFLPIGKVRRPRIGLVLSGGGARGIASVGVLKALEKAGIPVDMVVGTSIGSIVGGLYCSGYSADELERITSQTNWGEVLSYDDEARRQDLFLDQKISAERSFLVLRFDGFEPVIPASFSSGQRLTNYLNQLTLQSIYHPSPSFDDLRIPFRAVTTDLISGKQYVFKEGDLTQALRASVAVPLLFSTVPKDSMELLDGGLLANLPVDVARHEGMDIVVAVDVTSPLRPASMVSAPWEVGEQIMGIMMQEANRVALSKTDVAIRPELGDHLSSDFGGLPEVIAAGERSAQAAIPAIRAILARRELEMMSRSDIRAIPHPRIGYDPVSLADEDRMKVASFADRDTVMVGEIGALITDMYAGGGYADVEAQISVVEGQTKIFIRAERTPILNAVAVEGVHEFPADSITTFFAPLLGQPINENDVRHVLEQVLSAYRSRGLSLAHIESTAFDSATGQGTVVIDEGTIYRIDIKGTHKTKDYVIWRELPYGKGDVFRVSQVLKGIENIYSTNLFEQASISVHREGAHGELDVVTINARERYTELIRFGLRIDNERNIQPSIDVRDDNFRGIGAELGLRIFGGTRNYSAIAEFKAVRIFNSYLTSAIRGYVISKDINYFTDVPQVRVDRFDRARTGEAREVRRGGSLSFGTQLERLGNFTAEGRLEHHQVYNIYNTPIANQEYDISSIRFGTRVDTKDRYPYPTEGVGMDFTYESALLKTQGSIGFTKLVFAYETYATINGRHTIHPHFIVGLSDDAVPTTEQFSQGGQESFFGLREDNARGRQLFAASLEYRYKLPFKIFVDTYAKARYDVGSIWLKAEEIRLIDLLHAVGVGLGFDTPIGPVEVAVGRSFYLRKDLLDRPIALGPLLGYFSVGYPLN